MAETLGDPVLGSWAARCRKAPGTLILTASGARLVHVANDGPRTEIELSEGVELEVPREEVLYRSETTIQHHTCACIISIYIYAIIIYIYICIEI